MDIDNEITKEEAIKKEAESIKEEKDMDKLANQTAADRKKDAENDAKKTDDAIKEAEKEVKAE